MCWYDVLRDFQSAIVGVIGFAGVIITLRFNKTLAQSERIAARDQRELIVLRAAVAELRSFSRALENIDEGRILDPNETLLLPPIERKITLQLTKDIASIESIGSREVDEVLESLIAMDEFNRTMALFSERDRLGYFVVNEECFDNVKGLYTSTKERLDSVIDKLESKGLHSAKA